MKVCTVYSIIFMFIMFSCTLCLGLIAAEHIVLAETVVLTVFYFSAIFVKFSIFSVFFVMGCCQPAIEIK